MSYTQILILLVLICSCADSTEKGSSGGNLFQTKTVSNRFSLDLPTTGTYSAGDKIDISLDHSQIITVTGLPRIQLTIGSRSVYANYLAGNDTRTLVFRYVVDPSDVDLDGIEINNEVDLNGGSLTYTFEGEIEPVRLDYTLRGSSSILVNTIVLGPSVSNIIEPFNGTYATDGELEFQVEFEENISVTGTPSISILVGNQVRQALLQSSTSNTLVFTYTVQADDLDSDGITLNSNSIQLNGGTIISASEGNSAQLKISSTMASLALVLIDTNSGITPPDQVASLVTAPTTENTTLAISWSVPNNNGTNIINYALQYRTLGNSTWQVVSPNPTSNSTTVSGLSEEVVYEFRVAANNGLLGAFSSIANAEIFSIASLNPIAWLSATNITNGGIEPSDGDKITSWEDLSGVASAATEADVSRQPLYEENVFNGLPAVRFNGLTRSLEGTFTRVNNAGLTVFLVGKMDQNNSRKCFFEFYSTTITARGFFFNYGFNEASTNYNLDDTSFNVWTAYDDGSKTDLWENGNQVYTDITNWGPTAFTGSGAYVLGDDQTSGDQINGHIAEFLIFDSQLSPAEIAKIEAYLQNKWGTP